MVHYPNVVAHAPGDGPAYCTDLVLPGAEQDLGQPVPIPYAAAVAATVVFSASGPVPGNVSFVSLQTTTGGLNWVDVAFCTWTGTSGQAVLYLSGGIGGGNSIQQSRAAGAAPGNGSNQVCLGGSVRFAGKQSRSSLSSSSSSGSAGLGQVSVSVTYKLLGLR